MWFVRPKIWESILCFPISWYMFPVTLGHHCVIYFFGTYVMYRQIHTHLCIRHGVQTSLCVSIIVSKNRVFIFADDNMIDFIQTSLLSLNIYMRPCSFRVKGKTKMDTSMWLVLHVMNTNLQSFAQIKANDLLAHLCKSSLRCQRFGRSIIVL